MLTPLPGAPLSLCACAAHNLSSCAYFMSQQEYLFGTMWQRVMASPLRVRMHYGHPDLFDKVSTYTNIVRRNNSICCVLIS